MNEVFTENFGDTIKNCSYKMLLQRRLDTGK